MNCNGCKYEMEYAYELQTKGYNIAFEYYQGHKYLIAWNDEETIGLDFDWEIEK